MANCTSARLCLRHSSSTTKRLFSSSSSRRRNGPLTDFPPTSSAELDHIIATLRSNVFFPNHLARVHQQLVYRPSLQHYLTGDEPVEVTLPTTTSSLPSSKTKAPQNRPAVRKPGDFGPPNPHKNKAKMILAPLNRFEDEPRTRPTLNKVLELMQTTDDFALLPDLVREFVVSGRKMAPALAAKMVRKAADKGQMGAAIELFRRVESTGCRINEKEVAREVMRGAVLRAVLGGWEEGVLEKAVKNAEVAWRLLEDPKHIRVVEGVVDARELPEVAGAGLVLAAARAEKFRGGVDADGKVIQWVRRFLQTKGREEIALDESNWWDANEKLMRWAPVWVGGRLAATMLGGKPEMKELSKTVQIAEKVVEVARGVVEASMVEGKQRRGLLIYNGVIQVLE